MWWCALIGGSLDILVVELQGSLDLAVGCGLSQRMVGGAPGLSCWFSTIAWSMGWWGGSLFLLQWLSPCFGRDLPPVSTSCLILRVMGLYLLSWWRGWYWGGLWKCNVCYLFPGLFGPISLSTNYPFTTAYHYCGHTMCQDLGSLCYILSIGRRCMCVFSWSEICFLQLVLNSRSYCENIMVLTCVTYPFLSLHQQILSTASM